MEKEVFGTMDEKEKQALEDITDVFPHQAKIRKLDVGYRLEVFVFRKREMRSIAALLRKRHKMSLRDLDDRRTERARQRSQGNGRELDLQLSAVQSDIEKETGYAN